MLYDYTDNVLQLYMNQTFAHYRNHFKYVNLYLSMGCVCSYHNVAKQSNIFIFLIYLILENVLDEYEVDSWSVFVFR